MESPDLKFIVLVKATEVNRQSSSDNTYVTRTVEDSTYIWVQDDKKQGWAKVTQGLSHTIRYAALLTNAEANAVRDAYRMHNFSDPENCFIIPAFPPKQL